MEKFQVDLTEVASMLDPNRIPVKGNEHKLVRVAFDLFRVDGDEADDLWQIQADDDGNEFLVRTYSLPEEEKITEASDWSVLADKKYANLTISFKGLPLMRLASKDYGAENPRDGKSLQGVVFRKLSSDGEFVFKLLADLPQEKRIALKQAGLVDDLKNWLQSKDVTDSIIEKITKLVEEDVPKKKSEKKKKAADFLGDSEWKFAFLELQLSKYAKEAPYVGPIEQQTEKNKYFRKVLFTGDHAQLVLMSVKPGEELGSEVHEKVDQFFRIEEGEATFVLNGKKKHVKAGGAVIVPSGTEHNVINSSKTEPLKLYTIYSPPNHPPGTLQKTKEDAEKAEEKEQKADDRIRRAKGLWRGMPATGQNPSLSEAFNSELKRVFELENARRYNIAERYAQDIDNDPEFRSLEEYKKWYPKGVLNYIRQERSKKYPRRRGEKTLLTDQWKLAFLDLHLKTAHCGYCGQDDEDGLGEPFEQKAHEEEAIQEAYYMIEHDLQPGSVEAAELSELAWKVEQGDESYETLQAMMKQLKPEQEASEGSYREVFDNLLESYKAKYNVDSLDELPDEAKKELFEEADTRWTSEKEASVSRLANLGIPRMADIQANPDFYTPGGAFSGVDIVSLNDDLTQQVDELLCPKCKKPVDECVCPECDICGQPPAQCQCEKQDASPPPVPTSEKFDVTDVESGEGEWTSEEVELTEEDIEEVEPEKFVNPVEVRKILEEIKTLAPSDKEALELYLKS